MERTNDEQHWYAVRCVFRFPDPDSASQGGGYEERITLWQASSGEEAIELAEAEAAEYSSILSCEYVDLAQSFWLSETPGNGVEVFSLIRHSPLPPDKYLDAFFDTGQEVQRLIGGDDVHQDD